MKRTLFIILSVILTLGVVSGIGVSADPLPTSVGDYAFVPNCDEATISKVDLSAATPLEVARYSTVEPRTSPPYALSEYRVTRLAMDSAGNAWALNTMTGTSDLGTQGQVVRVSGGPVYGEDPGETSTSGGIGGLVANDVRVTRFNVGGLGDMPRAINIVETGGSLYLWIGFYHGMYFQKYLYNTHGTDDLTDDTLDTVGSPVDSAPYTPYTATIDNDGMLWCSSRASISVTGYAGVCCFDTLAPPATVTSLTYDPPGTGDNPYSILLKSDGTVWISDGAPWGGDIEERYFAVYNTGLADVVYVGTDVSLGAMRGFMEATDGSGDIWATGIDGQVIMMDWDGAGFEDGDWEGIPKLSGLDELTGIGVDAFGYYWVIRYGNNSMTRFNPATLGDQVTVALGDGPYAYGGFITPAAVPSIMIEKQVSIDQINWFDADDAASAVDASGYAKVYFRVIVTNTGNVPLTDVVVTDPDFTFSGVVTSLGVGESDVSDVLEADAETAAGVYENIARVDANYEPEPGTTYPVSDDDPANYKIEVVGNEGCTPGFWKNHTNCWVDYSSSELVGDVFAIPAELDSLSDDTLMEALRYKGGSKAIGAARILLRHAVAAVLNAAHPDIAYPMPSASAIIADVNAALDGLNRDTILGLKNQLDEYNNRGCSIDAHCNPCTECD